jgi:hypothetical protein
MTKSLPGTCLLLVLVILLSTGRSFADTVDQSFTSGNNEQTEINGCCAFIGQTYAAGLSGTLAGVTVDVSEFRGDNFSLDVQIRTTAGGLPTDTILGETSTTAFSLTDVIRFSQTVPQVAGNEYAIVVDFLGAPPPGGIGTGLWTGSSGNGYPLGIDVLSSDGGVTWAPDPFIDSDSHFITYVNPVPEPASALLVISGLLTLGIGFHRCRKWSEVA